nr:proline racemase family protein [Sphingomonas sp. Y57]
MHSRNVTVFADGEVDRSATGSGVSARAALERARGRLNLADSIRIESITGSFMDVRLIGEGVDEGYATVTPEVSGSAYVVGRSSFLFDRDDEMRNGFFLR